MKGVRWPLRLVLVTMLVASVAQPAGATAGQQVWKARYDSGIGFDAWDGGNALAVTPAGDVVFVAGMTASDLSIVALDAVAGSRRWIATFPGPGGWLDSALDVAISPDGSVVFTTGYVCSDRCQEYPVTPDDQAATMAVDAATGAVLWTATYGDTARMDYGSAIAVSPDGNRVYVGGGSCDNAEFCFWNRYAVWAYDAATGALLWEFSPATGRRGPRGTLSMVMAPGGGRLYAAMGSCGIQPDFFCAGTRILTLAIDTSTGAEVWRQTFDAGTRESDWGAGIVVDSGGTRVFVAGTSCRRADHGCTRSVYTVVAWDAVSGVREWVAHYQGPETSEWATAVGISPGGDRLFVTGHSGRRLRGESWVTLDVMATVSFDTTDGRILWVSRIPGADASDIESGGSSVYLAGGSSSGIHAIAARRGKLLWSDGFGSRRDWASSLVLASDGSRVYATGGHGGTDGTDDYWDMVTIAYEA